MVFVSVDVRNSAFDGSSYFPQLQLVEADSDNAAVQEAFDMQAPVGLVALTTVLQFEEDCGQILLRFPSLFGLNRNAHSMRSSPRAQ